MRIVGDSRREPKLIDVVMAHECVSAPAPWYKGGWEG
jgi:hypothetical protein